jgi:SAM-dependent methyltransferase
MKKKTVIDAQEELYDKKAPDYLKHHGDRYSQAYREKFIRRPLFNIDIDLQGIDLRGKKILDAMSAFGPETGFLIERGADVIGLDISPANARLYEKTWNRQCVVAIIHKSGLPNSFFDIVYICGGLHHILPFLSAALQEIHRLLKPGGYFYFMEPNKDTWLNELRVLWYSWIAVLMIMKRRLAM